jgi:hypothetical protein
MGAFTTIESGVAFLTIAILNELSAGYSERRQAATGLAPTTGGTPGALAEADGNTDVQAVGAYSGSSGLSACCWLALQGAIDALAPYFVDHTATIPAGATVAPAYTLATFRAAAGLHADGYRRATAYDPTVNDWTDPDDDMYSHGSIASGDIIGPWLVVDLQLALAALKWTLANGSFSGSGSDRHKIIVEGKGADCAAARADQIASWPEDDGTNGNLYQAYGYRTGFPSFEGIRNLAKPTVSGLYDGISHEAQAYGLPVGPANPGNFVFADTDSLGLVENEWYLIEEFAAASTSSRTGAWFVDTYDNPVELIPVDCDSTDSKAYGVKMTQVKWLLKWTFTNA